MEQDHRLKNYAVVANFLGHRALPFRVQFLGNECVFHLPRSVRSDVVEEAVALCRSLGRTEEVLPCSIWPSSRFMPPITDGGGGGF